MSPKQRASLAGLQPAPAAVPPLPVRPAAPPPAEVQTPEQQTPGEAEQGGRRRRPQERVAVPPARTPAPTPRLPKYLRLERKELLIWPDQITNLSILARVLNRNRGGAGERITTNTLIRVAAALLLSRSQDLAGTTEEELRRSLGLPDLQTPYLRSLGAADGPHPGRHGRTAHPAVEATGKSPQYIVDEALSEYLSRLEARSAAG